MQATPLNTTDYSPRFSTAAGQAYSIDTNGQNVTWASALTSSTGTLTKIGPGILTLSGTNTYAGTTIAGGVLAVSTDANLGSGGITIGAGTLQITGSTAFSSNKSITFTGSGTINVTATATATLSGSIAANGNATINIASASETLTLSGAVSGAGSLTKLGSGIVTLSGGNIYGGSATISQGTLTLGSTGALPLGTNLNGQFAWNLEPRRIHRHRGALWAMVP